MMDPGQNVQLIVEEDYKPETGLVQTQLQLMVVQIVLGKRLNLRAAMNRSAPVRNENKCQLPMPPIIDNTSENCRKKGFSKFNGSFS